MMGGKRYPLYVLFGMLFFKKIRMKERIYLANFENE